MPRNWLGKTLWDGNTSQVPSHCRPGTVACVLPKKKTSLKTPSQPRKPVPTAPFRNKMASRYSYFPVSHYQTDHQIFCFPFSVWMWTHRLRRCVCSVHKCVCTFVFQARRELWSRQSLTATDPFKLLSNHLCVVYLADTVKPRADSFFFPPERLDWMLEQCQECFP